MSTLHRKANEDIAMTFSDVLLCVQGAAIITITVIRLFVPFFLTPMPLQNRLAARNTTKAYLICRNIICFIVGAIVIVAAILPEHLKKPCCLPLLAIIFIIVLICNKILLGSFWVSNRD